MQRIKEDTEKNKEIKISKHSHTLVIRHGVWIDK
jgi:hypothetical protein